MESTRREFVKNGAAAIGSAVAVGMAVGASSAIAEEAAEPAAAPDGEAPMGVIGEHVIQEVATRTPLMDTTMEWHSIMIVYRDMDKALELWRDVLGFTLVTDSVTSGEYFDLAVWEDIFDRGVPPTFRCCCLQHDMGAMLELHQPIDPPMTELPEDAFSYWHPGVLEITLRVRDIDAWFEKIRAAGYVTTTDYVWDLGLYDRSFLFYDSEGHMIQLWECERHPRWM